MSKVIGIDLGTTNSCVAVMEGAKPTVIANAEGTRTTPSVVAFNKKKDLLIGEIAKRQAVMNHANTIHSVKRLIGRNLAELETEIKELSFGIKEDGSRVKIECPILNKAFSPEEISARILQKLARDASEYLGEPVTQAIVTVPAYFNDTQRQATRDAGQIAGLEIIRIITEPVAAALSYGLNTIQNQKVLVFDLGGGTFDVSVLEIGDNVFEVLSTSGDTHLGGDDFDKLIVDFLANNFKAIKGIDLRQDKQALQRLTEAAEKAKIELSYASVSEISLPFITATADGPKHLDISITRQQFENLSAPLIRRCLMAVEQVLKDAELTSSNELDEILLVGGSTRIPAVEDMIFNKLGKKPNKTVNPDEIVALGAAIQAAVLAGEKKDVLLLDAAPMSLGIRTESDRVSVLIPKNTTTPTKVSKVFATASDNQASVKINIIQGDNEYARSNKSLGIFTLSGLRPAPRGQTKVKVTFDCDANGILRVEAIDETTGKEQTITISDASRLEPSEIDQMTMESELCIFISYSTSDESLAQVIYTHLKGLGLNTKKAPEDISLGSDWPTAITEMIESATHMVLVWTGKSMQSKEVAKELTLAMQSGTQIIPFKAENLSPSNAWKYHLVNLQWLEAHQLSEGEALKRLATQITTTHRQLISKHKSQQKSKQLKTD